MKHWIKNIWPFLLWIFVFEAVSFASAMMTNDNIATWYAGLNAPPFVPPNFVFPVVWSILYAMIGCAGLLIWRSGNRKMISLFGFYMLLNWSWSFIYFEMHEMGIALAELVVMDIVLGGLIFMALRSETLNLRCAGKLLLPLMAWSLFATYLNAGYWWLN